MSINSTQTVLYISKGKPKKTYHRGEPEIETPKYTCKSCTKRTGKYCDCFLRHIEPEINKCSYHSNYNPILTVFKVRDDLDDLIQAETEKLSA